MPMESPFTFLIIILAMAVFMVVGYAYLKESQETKEALQAESVMQYVASVLKEASSSASTELDLNLSLPKTINGKKYTLSIVPLGNETLIVIELEDGKRYEKKVPVEVKF